MVSRSPANPFPIAKISPSAGLGLIGISACPGAQSLARGARKIIELGFDLDAISAWGAASVLTIMEQTELDALAIPRLGANIADRFIAWHHLPLKEIKVPSEEFQSHWPRISTALRHRLYSGFNILLHCDDGYTRSGTIAAMLLVELGWQPEAAIQAVRDAKPTALANEDHQAQLQCTSVVLETEPAKTLEAIRDRAVGALLGLAVGDAVGTTLEFAERDHYRPLTDMIGGGPFHLKAGQWTDDTSMALALADSLIEKGKLNPRDLMRRFLRWYRHGEYSWGRGCFDIGNATADALELFEEARQPYASDPELNAAGNGSLMRLSPVAIRWWNKPEERRSAASRQSRTTHAAPEAVDACVVFADLISDAIGGIPARQVLAPRELPLAGQIAPIIAGRWRGKHRAEIESSGYVAHSLEAALWAVGRSASFEEAVLTAANLGGDADTIAAIAGQLAGALYGASGIPPGWQKKLVWRKRIEDMAMRLWKDSVVLR